MYGRTIEGYICKLEKVEDGEYQDFNDIDKHIKTLNIIDCSFNIIDLLKVGDYLNGQKILDVNYYKDLDVKNKKDGVALVQTSNIDYFDDDFPLIIEVVTKEQFEKIKYRAI